MIVLHAGFSEGSLLLWGESPASEALSSARSRKPSRVAEGMPPLPYDAGAGLLRDAVAGVADLSKVRKKDFEQVFAWLPTRQGKPTASTPLIAAPLESTGDERLVPWAVTALPLQAGDCLALLCACVGKELLKPGVVLGNDLAYWVAAMRLAGAVVARQQFVPAVVKTQGGYRAYWKLVIAGPDNSRVRQLAESMPPAAQAISQDPDPLPCLPAQARLAIFMDLVADHLVRNACKEIPPTGYVAAKRRERAPGFESLHDQWLSALRSPDGLLQGEEAELAAFAAQVREWQRPALAPVSAAFRLCFRLEEPPEEGEPEAPKDPGSWQVRYLLQAAHDPSLLIPAREAWKPKPTQSALFQRNSFNVQEYLLTSLGQAAGLCPRIETSLRGARPEGYALDAVGAHEFLTQTALALEQSGFGVMLPAWWSGKGTKLRLGARAHVKSPALSGGAGLSLEDLVEFRWEMALGNESVSLEELQALARLKAPLVKVRGQWVQLTAEEIQAALDLWKNRPEGAMKARDVMRMALGASPLPLAIEGVTATGWVGDLLAQLEGHGQFEELPAPGGFQGTLRPYQVRGFSWLAFLRRWGLGACLADDMGLGKTIQTLALFEREACSNGEPPVLLICPTSVVGNWHKEAARFTPHLRVMVHHGLARTRSKAFAEEAAKHHLVISTYALLPRDFEILKEVSWRGVVLDEAQNIKNPETKQARAARGVAAGYRIALTGTPVENNVGDLWSIMEFLNPGLLGTQGEFKKSFFIPIQAARDQAAVNRLKKLTGPFILRRLKTDKTVIADLPEKMEMKVFCNLTKEQASLYAAVVEEAGKALESAEGIQRKGVVLATLSKLKQVCNHPAQFLGDNSSLAERSGKLARLAEMAEELLETGDRALIFSQFAEMGAILKRYLEETFGRETLFLHGAVPKKQRDRMVERFQQEDHGPPFFILSLKAGGTGLNLTRASHVFHFDRWWNPAVENQATDRAFRIGQTKNVQVHKFLCVGTLEEKIDEMIERKKEIAAGVVGTGEGWLTELSTAELKEIFALRPESVEA